MHLSQLATNLQNFGPRRNQTPSICIKSPKAISTSSLSWASEPPTCCFSGPNIWFAVGRDLSAQQCKPTHSTMDTTVAAHVSTWYSGTPTPLLLLLKQHLGCCWFHSNREVEMVVHGWLWIQEPYDYWKEIYKLMPRWNKCINVLRDEAKNNILSIIKGTAVAQWLRSCATNRKVTGSIPASVSGFFIDKKSFRLHYGPGVDS